VALLDADIGLRNLDLLLGLENRVLYTAIDILEGECRLDQALIRDKRWKNLSLLSISRNRQRCARQRGWGVGMRGGRDAGCRRAHRRVRMARGAHPIAQQAAVASQC
jgi:hypothetical protein